MGECATPNRTSSRRHSEAMLRMDRRGPDTSQSARNRISLSMTAAVFSAFDAHMMDVALMMARLYTGEELATMRDFNASPEGKSIMQKQPKVMEEYMPKVMA